jgi:hypothetical protein
MEAVLLLLETKIVAFSSTKLTFWMYIENETATSVT